MGKVKNKSLPIWVRLFLRKKISKMTDKGYNIFEDIDENIKAKLDDTIDTDSIEDESTDIKDDRYYKTLVIPEEVRKISVFSKDGKFINLNNFTVRTNRIAVRRNELLRRINDIAIDEAKSAGKNRTDFASFKSAIIMLTEYLNVDNIVIGDNKRYNYLNVDGLKALLATDDFGMASSTATMFIRCAKKAKILKQIGKGKAAKFMMNPAIHLNSYFLRISTEVFFEFPLDSALYFNKKQYNYLCTITIPASSPEEKKRLKDGINYGL